jgi:hypothetical protein
MAGHGLYKTSDRSPSQILGVRTVISRLTYKFISYAFPVHPIISHIAVKGGAKLLVAAVFFVELDRVIGLRFSLGFSLKRHQVISDCEHCGLSCLCIEVRMNQVPRDCPLGLPNSS